MIDETETVESICERLPKEYYFCQKRLWCGDKHVDVEHFDRDLDKPLDYKTAALKMLKLIEKSKEN